MKKIYKSPEMEVLKCVFIKDCLEPSGEIVLPSSTAPNETPTGTEMPDF